MAVGVGIGVAAVAILLASGFIYHKYYASASASATANNSTTHPPTFASGNTPTLMATNKSVETSFSTRTPSQTRPNTVGAAGDPSDAADYREAGTGKAPTQHNVPNSVYANPAFSMGYVNYTGEVGSDVGEYNSMVTALSMDPLPSSSPTAESTNNGSNALRMDVPGSRLLRKNSFC